MSYAINTTNGNILLTLQDGTTDTSTGLTLIGKNYTNYGLLQNDNFVRLLENFADTIPPTQSSSAFAALTGTLWYDTANQVLKAYDGTNFNVVSGRQSSTTAPTAKNIGDQWWDTVNLQLNTWTGSSWHLIGPSYAYGQGITGTIAGTIVDTQSNFQTVANTYSNGQLISIASNVAFTPITSIPGFPAILAGINISNTALLNGVSTNSEQLGGYAPNQYARADITTNFEDDVYVAGNLILSENANIAYINGNLNFQNQTSNGDIIFYANTNGIINSVLHIQSSTGNIYAQGGNLLVTQPYVNNAISKLSSQITQLNSNVSTSATTINGTTISLGGSGTVTAAAGSLTGSVLNPTVTLSSLTTVGTLTGLTVSGNIVPSSNVSINLGSSTAWFNTFYGSATEAQYADLAENYQADQAYKAGTVVMFGGEEEVTLADEDTTAVAGIVSTNPAHLMNGALIGPNVVPVALQGRVPCQVIGPVKKGDLMVSAGNGYARASKTPQLGQVIGKALENFNESSGIIEVVVGRV
jgi:hypothetical protein